MDNTVVDLKIHFLAGGHLAPDDGGPFLLEDDSVWLVAAGELDVFAVRVAAGEPVGPRAHLVQVREREAAFGQASSASDGWGFLAVLSRGSRLVRMGRREFEARDRRHGGGAALLGRWIDALYAAMAGDKLPASSIELLHGVEREVAPEQSIRIRDDVAWVKHIAGHSRLMGRQGLELNGDFTPISRRAWFQAATPSRLVAIDMSELRSSDEVWLGLDRLHDLVKRFVDASARAAEAVALERMRQRGAFQQALLRDSCESLAATINGAGRASSMPPDRPIAVAALDDPLFVACCKVGRALGIRIEPDHGEEDAPGSSDRLGAILRASRVRARRVALAGEWWTEDNGPLLAVRAADKLPVALLPDGVAGPYLLHDPRDGSATRVDAAVAESLEPFASSLYRPFPPLSLRVRDLVRFAMRGNRRDVLVVVAMVVCAALVGMVPAIATGVLFETVIPGAQRSQLVQMTFVLLACAAVTALFTVAQSIALLRIETRASSALQAAVWDRLLAVPLRFFRNYTAGDLASRAMAVDAMRQAVSGPTVSAMVGAVVALGNVVLMFWYSSVMALWAMLILAVVLSASLVGSWLQLRPQRGIVRTQSRLAGLVLQLLTSIAKLRAAAAEVAAFALWSRQFGEQRRHQYRVRVVSNWLAAFAAAVPVLANLVIFAIALPRIVETHQLGTGDFMAFLTAFTTASTSILTGTPALVSVLNTIPLYEQARPILETPPEVDAGKAQVGPLVGDIEVQHATFRYHADGPPILRDLSLRIQPGEFAAFVGSSGSGKSTLLRLLLGFETLEAGAIYYDGQEIGGLDVQALRRQMGVVLQSGRLMSGDIYRNIIGASSASIEEAWAAARMAGLAEDIEAMPMGMHTILSEGGGTLSGGQRQRLLIARALISRPRILLFDEATSALDNRTQAIVSASLESLQATRVVIAHRLSTIVNAHRIFVMERGRIVQTGTYAELMSQNGPFAELARRQIA